MREGVEDPPELKLDAVRNDVLAQFAGQRCVVEDLDYALNLLPEVALDDVRDRCNGFSSVAQDQNSLTAR
jgi:hypothetical protein